MTPSHAIAGAGPAAVIDLTDSPQSSGCSVAARVEAPFRLLADHFPVGVFVLDADRQVVYANRVLSELAGFETGRDDRRPGPGALHADDRQRVAAAVRRVYDRAESRLPRLSNRLGHRCGASGSLSHGGGPW